MAKIYVRKSGNDSNDGSTPALAKLTVKSAYTDLTAGDVIVIGAGIYNFATVILGTKDCTFFGDTTGELTGDAGDVIFSGINESTREYITFATPMISITATTTSNITYFKNIIFSYIKCATILYMRSCVEIDNCKFLDCYNTNNLFIDLMVGSGNTATIKNTIIKRIVGSGNLYGIQTGGSEMTANFDNVLIDSISAASTSACRGISQYGTSSGSGSVGIYKNVTIKNIFSGNYPYGFSSQDASGIANVTMYNCNISGCKKNIVMNSQDILKTYNCNFFTIQDASVFPTDTTHTNLKSSQDYEIDIANKISKFSPLKGQGSTTFSSEDINGNPRPAYGNGTACDIGAVESTSDIIQKESTIKDSGDYSVKVAPCNYFKKTFQIPVTASELRTVKVKIRIDGTWGTYRPKITLSGQGMTVSSATKNSTTGSFEELTVSGTPTTTGIALLTIEAHSANTDAAFYIDTITIE